VATTDVAEAVSINSYNFSRRMSATPAEAGERSELPASTTMRKPNHLFSRSHTATPQSVQGQQPPRQSALRRQTSAVPLKTRMSSSYTGGVPGGHSNVCKATEAFTRSKTQYTTAIPPPVPSRLVRKSSDLSGRGSVGSVSRSSAGSPSVRGSVQNFTNLSAFYSTPIGSRQQGSGSSDLRESQRRSSTLSYSSGGAKPPAATAGGTSSFYNPAVIQSLRERSTSDANRTGPGTKKAADSTKLTSSSKKKLSTTGEVASAKTLVRTSSGVPSSKKKPLVTRTSTEAGAAGTPSSTFHKTHAEQRLNNSDSGSSAVKGRVSMENVPVSTASAPHVPKLNLAGVAGNC
jgi:hypothetical protein